MAGQFIAIFIQDAQLHIAPHDQHVTLRVFQGLRVLKVDHTTLVGFQEGLLPPLRNAANVECPHCQLRTRFTD